MSRFPWVFFFLAFACVVHAQEASEPVEKTSTAKPASELSLDREALVAWLREAYAKPAPGWPKATLDEGRPLQEIGPVEGPPPDSVSNPSTPEKKRLGLSLFFDPRLSKSQGVSCASCHEPQLGWSNGVTFSFGEHRTQISRHPPTLIGVGFHKKLFWDGRTDTLEGQAADVIVHPVEMNGDPAEVVARLEKETDYYPPLFEKAFGDPAVTFERITQALAVFQRGLLPGRTKFDRFAKGKTDAFSDSELVGLHLFRTKARCMNCHMGPMFTDDEFHNVGLTYYGRKLQDLGRYEVTKKTEDVGKFRTASLRNVGRTAPYMHNGIFPHLEGILRLYNAGMPRPKPKEHQMGDPLFPKTSEILQPLKMSPEELDDLKSFLLTLSEPPARVLFPPIPPLQANTPLVPGSESDETP